MDDLRRTKRDPKPIIESRQTLRILLGLVGNLLAAWLTVDNLMALLDGVQRRPKNATQRAEYRTLSVKQTVALSKANGEPPPKAWALSKHWDRMAVFFRHLHAAGVLDRDLTAAIVRHSAKTEAVTGRPFLHAELRTFLGAKVRFISQCENARGVNECAVACSKNLRKAFGQSPNPSRGPFCRGGVQCRYL